MKIVVAEKISASAVDLLRLGQPQSLHHVDTEVIEILGDCRIKARSSGREVTHFRTKSVMDLRPARSPSPTRPAAGSSCPRRPPASSRWYRA